MVTRERLTKLRPVLRNFLVSSGLLVGMWWGGSKLYTFFTPSSIEIAYKNIYSEMLKNDLDHFVSDYLSTCNYSVLKFDTFYKDLKEKFKVVKGITWRRDSLDKVLLTIEGVQPRFIVNDQFILGNKRRLFSCSLFSTFTREALHSIQVNGLQEDGKIPDHAYAFLQKVPQGYFDKFGITYAGKNCVWLDKMSLKFVVDEFSVGDEHKMKLVEFVHDDFVNRLKNKRLGAKTFVFYDLRFKDRICAKVVRN